MKFLIIMCIVLLSSYASATEWVPGQILIQPKTGVPDHVTDRLVRYHGGSQVGNIPQINTRIIKVPEHAVIRVTRALSRNPNISFAEPDYIEPLVQTLPNDPRYGDAWHFPIINAPAAWDLSKGDGVIVAILDTGIHAGHPDFQGKLVPGWNSVSQNTDLADVNGHGTKVAGTVGAATNNAIGVAAVGWNAMIMPIKVSNRDDGSASSSDMARAVTWAADNGAHVANMSYQSWRHSTVQSASNYMRSKGGIVFGSAGNGSTDTLTAPTRDVVVVGATTSTDRRASWSNYGEYVDITAPGASILSTSGPSGYGTVSGTSFSSPIAAAVAALIIAVNPDLTPAEIESIMYSTAVDLGAEGWDPYFGWGRVDAAAAVEAALEAVKPVDPGPVDPGPVDPGPVDPGPVDPGPSDPPVLNIVEPESGSTVSGNVRITVEASTTTNILLFINGSELCGGFGLSLSCRWQTNKEPVGEYTILATAHGTSTQALVNIDAESKPPGHRNRK